MSDAFLRHWFKGLERSLCRMTEEDRNAVWRECGKACSDSYTKQVYVDAYARSENIRGFLARLQDALPEMDFCLSDNDRSIHLTYRFCACDLVRKGYVNTPLLCECSRQSLLHNWEAVLGEGRVEVELLQSILGGGNRCRFAIRILP